MVLFIDKYVYGENQVANPNYEMSYFCYISQKLYFLFVLPFTIPKESANLLAYDNLFIFYWRIYLTVRDFNLTVKKSLNIPVLVNDIYQAINDTANPILFKF
jgi:hypothetical protein